MGKWMDLVRPRARRKVTAANKTEKMARALCEPDPEAISDRPMFSLKKKKKRKNLGSKMNLPTTKSC